MSSSNFWETKFIDSLKEQKPNNIDGDALICDELCRLQIYLKPISRNLKLNISNNSLEIEIDNDDNKLFIEYNGMPENSSKETDNRYYLRGIIIYAPSRNSMLSKRFPVEMNMVFRSKQGERTVIVGTFYNLTDENKTTSKDFFKLVTENFPQKTNNTEFTYNGTLINLIPPIKSIEFYTYITDPTTSWIFFKNSMTVSTEFYNKFVKYVQMNPTNPNKNLNSYIQENELALDKFPKRLENIIIYGNKGKNGVLVVTTR